MGNPDNTTASTVDDLTVETDHGYTATTDTAVPFGIREGGPTLGEQSTGGWHEGAGVLYNAFELGNNIAEGDWAEGLTHGAVTLIGTAGAMADPIGTLITGAISWLMDHIEPLPTFLDWLAGDPDAVSAFSSTWANVAQHVDEVAQNFSTYIADDLGDMTAVALTIYRGIAQGHALAVSATGVLCGATAKAVQLASLIIDTVRCIVRDLIAECLSQLIQIALKCAGPQIVVFGADAVRQILALVARYVPKCRGWIDTLTRVITKLCGLTDGILTQQSVLNILFNDTLPNLGTAVSTWPSAA